MAASSGLTVTSAWLISCQNFQVSVSPPLAKFIYTAAHSLHAPVTEVERAAALLRSIGLDKQIKKVDTVEDKIVYSGTSGEEFVRFSTRPIRGYGSDNGSRSMRLPDAPSKQ